MTATALRQEPRPLLIGERLNTQGSRKVKALALEDRLEEMIPIARAQVEGGAHVLDVCMALTERTDEAAMLRRLVKKLSLTVEAPLCLDSTEPHALEEALKACPGVALVNSINLENGRERIDAVMPLVVKYGAAVIALTIDEQGMAKTAARKLEVARRLHDIVTREYGLPPGRLVVRPAHVHARHRRRGVPATPRSRRSRASAPSSAELPGVLTSLGVSNVSFGLSQRGARRRQLGVPVPRRAGRARHGHREPGRHHALRRPRPRPTASGPRTWCWRATRRRWRSCSRTSRAARPPRRRRSRTTDADEGAPGRAAHPPADPAPAAGEGIEALVDEAVARSDAVTVLNTVLLPAMKEVGDKFGSGELILPFVLQSAEVMKKAVARLETYLERNDDVTKGRVVLATVYGDVHDIGKNLVKTILVNNGYTVVRPGQAGAGADHPREGAGDRRRRHRPVGPAGLDQQADAGLRGRAAPRRACASRC